MAKNVTIECIYCGFKEDFDQYKEATYHQWSIVGWHMNTNTPYGRCPKCNSGEDIKPQKISKKKRK